MSVITDVAILCPYGERDAIEELNRRLYGLDQERRQQLRQINTDSAGGVKVFTTNIYAASFNYLTPGDFEEAVAATNWRHPDCTMVYVHAYDYGMDPMVRTVDDLRRALPEERDAQGQRGGGTEWGDARRMSDCPNLGVPKEAVEAMIAYSARPVHDDGHVECYYGGMILAALPHLGDPERRERMRFTTYRLFVECKNCGFRGDVDIPKGRRLAGRQECPTCECRTLTRAHPTRWDRPEINLASQEHQPTGGND